ncbi:MAG: TolC family protein [Planctomycetes bacterium]|nr:TolC family protein [Planctomycetota bacterium]
MRIVVALALLGSLVLAGCHNPVRQREKADKIAAKIIAEKQQEALGRTEPLSIERPSDILRRRLIEAQNLPVSSTASLGTDALKPIPHWPDKEYPPESHSPDANIPIEPNKPLQLSLIEALQIAAHNSPTYQDQKEAVFSAALSLDQSRNIFRNLFTAGAGSDISLRRTGGSTVAEATTSGDVRVSRALESGAGFTAGVAVELLDLLTQGGGSSKGIQLDGSLSIPLLRGSSRYTNSSAVQLTTAERNMVYAIWTFERQKRQFALDVVTVYFSVLQQMDTVMNQENNYRAAIQNARFSRRLADAGRLTQIQAYQASLSELNARTSWVSARQSLQDRLDTFKGRIGLPMDAQIKADPNDLMFLRARGDPYVEKVKAAYQTAAPETAVAADAEPELVLPTREDAGPYEIDEEVAIRLALENRLDLRAANGRVYDRQREVVLRADAFRARLDLGVGARFGGGAPGVRSPDVGVDLRDGTYTPSLGLDVPINLTEERVSYRGSLIALEAATRAVQRAEDQIKTDIRSRLRSLLEQRERLKIAAQQVVIAENSVNNSRLLLEAGRAVIRDLVEAQIALVDAQNALTAAVITYRRTELQLQADMDLLTITQEGLMQEFSPEELRHDS